MSLLSIIIGIDPSLLASALYLASSLSFSAPRTPPPFIIHDGRHQNSVISRYIARPVPTESATFLQRNAPCSFQRLDRAAFDFPRNDKYLLSPAINSPILYSPRECNTSRENWLFCFSYTRGVCTTSRWFHKQIFLVLYSLKVRLYIYGTAEQFSSCKLNSKEFMRNF